jgi:hypothetical protein
LTNITLGSVWATEDRREVVVVVGMNEGGVLADGWVSYGTRGTMSFDSTESFLREFPVFVFRTAAAA